MIIRARKKSKGNSKVKKERKSRVEKIFGSGTYTNAGFFGMIRAALRNKSRWWKPIALCLNDSRRRYKGANKRQKFEYQCNHCRQYFNRKLVEVNHKIPAGKLNCFEDLPNFVRNLFCEKEFLEVLCYPCHEKFHKNTNCENETNIGLYFKLEEEGK